MKLLMNLLLVGLALAAPGSAWGAETGFVWNGMAGDSKGAASQDLLSVQVGLDAEVGSASAIVKLNGGVVAGPPSFIYVTVGTYDARRVCQAKVGGFTFSTFSDGEYGFFSIGPGPTDFATRTFPDANTVKLAHVSQTYKGLVPQCVRVIVSPRDNGGDTLDSINGYYPGFAPPVDTDGDGKADTADKCPTQAAATDDGCPAPVVPDPVTQTPAPQTPAPQTPAATTPAPTVPAVKSCTLPKGLRGKSEKQAKSAIRGAANCAVGKTKRPRGKLRKGFALKVSKATLRADGSNKVDLTLRAVRK